MDADDHRSDLPRQRRDKILSIAQRDGWLQAADLARRLGVSPGTVRRDLRIMAGLGLLTRVRGGAVGAAGAGGAVELGRRDRPGPDAARTAAAQEVIVDFAARLVRPATTIAVSADVMAESLVNRLVGVPRLTVVTNSLVVATLLSRHDQVLLVTGGVPSRTGGLTGPIAELTVRSLNIDQFFFAPYGMDARSGFTAAEMADAGICRALMAAAHSTIVLADHQRWDTVGIAGVAPLDRASQVICDSGLPVAAQHLISRNVRDVRVLPVPAP